MLSQYTLDIIRVISDKQGTGLTINQISKLIKKSYFFTNQLVRKMIRSELLTKRIIGHSILCFLNQKNEETAGLLIMDSIIKKKNFEKSAEKDSGIRSLIMESNRLFNYLGYEKETILNSAFIYKDCLFLLSNNSLELHTEINNFLGLHNTKESGLVIKIIEPDDLKKKYQNSVILHGREYFWKKILELK
ncbi:hypothetical protein ACFL0W_06690 [Nanoarchaeota archaeon]